MRKLWKSLLVLVLCLVCLPAVGQFYGREKDEDMSLKGDLRILMDFIDSDGDYSALSDSVDHLVLNPRWTFSNGTGADNANAIWHDERLVAGGALDIIDLTTLTDSFGQSLAFTKVRLLYIQNLAVTGADITMSVGKSGSVSNSFSDSWMTGTNPQVLIGGGLANMAGAFLLVNPNATGYAVDGTHKNLGIFGSAATSLTYRILIIGES